MKKSYLILLFFISVNAQVRLKKDKIIQNTDSTYTIISNKILAPLKINFYDVPLENLKNRMGENLDGKDIYFFKNDIIVLGSCCVGVSEIAQFQYNAKVNNWLLYKTVYIEKSTGLLTDIDVQYYPYSFSINGKKYPANEKLYLQNSIQNKKISETIFNVEYEKLKLSKNLTKYNFKYSYEDLYLLLKNIPITESNINKYNDLAFYLAQNEKISFEAIYLYNEILQKFPDRIVAYLNLGDCYWSIGNEDLAKENYKKYIDLMKSQKKDLNKIPKYVWERIK